MFLSIPTPHRGRFGEDKENATVYCVHYHQPWVLVVPEHRHPVTPQDREVIARTGPSSTTRKDRAAMTDRCIVDPCQDDAGVVIHHNLGDEPRFESLGDGPDMVETDPMFWWASIGCTDTTVNSGTPQATTSTCPETLQQFFKSLEAPLLDRM